MDELRSGLEGLSTADHPRSCGRGTDAPSREHRRIGRLQRSVRRIDASIRLAAAFDGLGQLNRANAQSARVGINFSPACARAAFSRSLRVGLAVEKSVVVRVRCCRLRWEGGHRGY